jgi:hypothetical protein
MAYPVMEAVLRRRDFITVLGGAAAAWPFPAQAQKTDRLARIGVLMGYAETDSEAKALLGEFTHALSEFGWIERQNLRMDVRWAPGKTDLMRTFYAAITAANSQELITPRPDTHPEITQVRTRMCVNAEDAYELALQDAKEGKLRPT